MEPLAMLCSNAENVVADVTGKVVVKEEGANLNHLFKTGRQLTYHTIPKCS